MLSAVEAFLLSRQVAGCTSSTVRNYHEKLLQFAKGIDARTLDGCTLPVVQAYLTTLRDRVSPVTVFIHFGKLRAFFAWCVDSDLLPESPVKSIKMRAPKTLPRVPEDEAVVKLLQACGDDFAGRRNKALVALLADSGLRISEALRLRIEDFNFASRTLNVRSGKGQADRTGFFGAEAAQHVRAWLSRRRDAHPEDHLFVDRRDRSLTRSHAVHILHRLSVRAGLPRKVGPHQLRHYSATSILKQTGDLELVRQVLGHSTLTMSLRYAHLTKPDVSAKFRRASPLDNLRAGR